MKRTTVFMFAVTILSLLFFGCTSSTPSGGDTGKAGCGSFGPPPKITGVSPCGSTDSPAVVSGGAPTEYKWNADACYDHFTFQLEKGTDWGTESKMAEVDGLRGNAYATASPTEEGSYMWNVRGFDEPDDAEPKTAIYPPCYFKIS